MLTDFFRGRSFIPIVRNRCGSWSEQAVWDDRGSYSDCQCWASLPVIYKKSRFHLLEPGFFYVRLSAFSKESENVG